MRSRLGGGRIQMSKTNYLQAVMSDLQRTAGPYSCATTCREQTQQSECVEGDLLDHLVGASEDVGLERMLPPYTTRCTMVLHPAGREAERSELKRAFCSSLSEL